MAANYPNLDKLRKERKPSVVRIGHAPDWFTKRVSRVFGPEPGMRGPLSHYAAIERVQRVMTTSVTWFDHFGSTRLADGSVAFVSEPYNTIEAVTPVVTELAKALGCAWYISDNSYWYPGSTIRIVFHEDADSIPLTKLQRKTGV